MHPPVDQRLGGLLRQVVVAAHDHQRVCGPDPQLARLPRRDVPAGVVDQPQLVAVAREAALPADDGVRRAVEHRPDLAHAVDGGQVEAEPAPEPVDVAGQRRHDREIERVVGVVGAGLGLLEELGHRPEHHGDGDAVLADRRPEAADRERRLQHARRAVDQGLVDAVPLAGEVEQRQRDQDAVAGHRARLVLPGRVGVGVRVGDQHALGTPRGARGVHERHQVGGVQGLRRHGPDHEELVEGHHPEPVPQPVGGRDIAADDQGPQRRQVTGHVRDAGDGRVLADQRGRAGVVEDVGEERPLVGGVDRDLDHPAEPDPRPGVHGVERVVQQQRDGFLPADAEAGQPRGDPQRPVVAPGDGERPARADLGDLVGHVGQRPVVRRAQGAVRHLRQSVHRRYFTSLSSLRSPGRWSTRPAGYAKCSSSRAVVRSGACAGIQCPTRERRS